MAKSLSFTSCKTIITIALLMVFTALTRASMETSYCNFTFFMHDILRGPYSSERVVAGTTVTTTHNKIPFSKSIHTIYGTQNNVVIDKRNMLPYVRPGSLPLGATLMDKVVFGRVTVFDYEVTRGRDYGSHVIGRAQGFHLATSWDGTSKTMVFTVVLFGGDDEDDMDDTVSFFGVHRTAQSESSIAVVGGTGKYENAKGIAKLEAVHLLPSDQQITSGVDIILQTTVYLTLYTNR